MSVDAVRAGPGPPWRTYRDNLRQRMQERARFVRLMPTGGRALLVTAILVQIVAGVTPVFFVVATAQMIGEVPATVRDGIDSAAWHSLRFWMVAVGAAFLVIQILAPVQSYLGELMRRRVDNHVRDSITQASFAPSGIAVLEDPELLDNAAEAINSMQFGTNTPGAACSGLIALISRYLQSILCAGLVGVALSWPAAVGVLVAGLTIRFGYRLGLSAFGRVYRSLHRIRRKAWYFRDLLLQSNAAKEIRTFGLVDWLLDRYTAALLASYEPVWKARRRIFYGPYVAYTAVAFLLVGLTLGWAGGAAARGLIGVGALMMAAQGTLSTIRIGGFIAESDVQTEYGTLAHRSAIRFAELTGAQRELPTARHLEPDLTEMPLNEIRFENVTFRYSLTGPVVLDGLDLTIPAKRSLAIVGLNGAGKTTLIKLLARLYEPTSGRITVDGVDIRSFPVGAWQRRVAAIFQDFVRFELPVRENVGVGAVELLDRGADSDPLIRSALSRAGAIEIVDALPQGLDTVLSRQYAGGADLSGGQWQRIAIARALFAVDNGVRILVLDEPTASLDVRAEVEFFEQFLQLTGGTTSVVISHRFSTVRRADQIVVLQDGRVIEHGSHAELLACQGRYAELFELQASRFTAPGGAA